MRLLLFVLLLAQRVVAADTVAYRVQTYVYKTVGAEELQLDVFVPETAASTHSVIILFHGGSWISGDRHQLYQQCRYFAQRGMVAVTADYRLLNRATASKNGSDKDSLIADAKSAVRWVKKHAAEWHIDPERIILGGASAGGHLATMAVLNDAIDDPRDDRSITITARALVLFNPAYNPSEDAAVQPYAFAGRRIPPVVFFYGSKDKWKPAGDSLRTQLKKTGADCELWVADGQVHGFFNKAPWTEATCTKAQAFLCRLGLMQPGSVPPGPHFPNQPSLTLSP
ncbi:MAG: alpha/beta hydrolase [Bacteroidetes bacterium]|nr:alpha/beta hydrolase [Bacteroidota bacterium]